jgi:hypothetical protein
MSLLLIMKKILSSASFLSLSNPEKGLDWSDLPEAEKQLLENCCSVSTIFRVEKFW